MQKPNFPTGSSGLIAVDKVGNQILFLDPDSYRTTLTLEGFAPRVHELLISPDGLSAYVPIYGDGIHGNNPHPGQLLAVFDLIHRRHIGDFSVAPYLAPHALRWGPRGQLYCLCENSGVLLEMDSTTGAIRHVIEVGSDKAHRMEILPDGGKLYTENEEDPFASVIDLVARKRVKSIPAPGGLAGIGMSPDGKVIILVDATRALLLRVDTATDEIVETIKLTGHDRPAQIARYSPDGRYLVVTNMDAALATIFSADLTQQRLLRLWAGTMDMAFKDDGRTVAIANQNAGTISICDLERGEIIRTVHAGIGIETLAFF